MIELLRAMFATPEAQADAYTWAAVLMGHWALGAALSVLVIAVWARSPWSRATMLSIAYAAGWEGGQLWGAAIEDQLTLALLWDSVVDWIAVTLGALTIAAVWQHRSRLAVAAIGAISMVLATGCPAAAVIALQIRAAITANQPAALHHSASSA